MGVFPSGQRGQTVNLLRFASVVRIHPLPPKNRLVKTSRFFYPLRKQWHIINTALPCCISSVRQDCISSRVACIKKLSQWWYTKVRVDDMQFLRNWWYTRLCRDYSAQHHWKFRQKGSEPPKQDSANGGISKKPPFKLMQTEKTSFVSC